MGEESSVEKWSEEEEEELRHVHVDGIVPEGQQGK